MNVRELLIELSHDLQGRLAAMFEVRETDISCRKVRRVGKLQRVITRHSRQIVHAVDFVSSLHHLPHDIVGTGQRGAFRQLGSAENVELVLRRDEAAGHPVEQYKDRSQQYRVDKEHAATETETLSDSPLIRFGAPLEKP